jgi:LAS superfamily LD-carboxypeptidase LdcB
VNAAELTGRARSHLAALPADVSPLPDAGVLHAQAIAPFLRLRNQALRDGFDLKALSGFRDFERQLGIWNGKYQGERPTYDAAGQPMDLEALEPAEKVTAILQWSALPGASRHHWGTDMDLIDARAVGAGYRVRLTADEYAPGGPFHALRQWLEANAARFGFFRPYRGIVSGVQPEPWHYSFAPLAEAARHSLSLEVLAQAIESAPLCGKAEVLARLDQLHARYVDAIDPP